MAGATRFILKPVIVTQTLFVPNRYQLLAVRTTGRVDKVAPFFDKSSSSSSSSFIRNTNTKTKQCNKEREIDNAGGGKWEKKEEEERRFSNPNLNTRNITAKSIFRSTRAS